MSQLSRKISNEIMEDSTQESEEPADAAKPDRKEKSNKSGCRCAWRVSVSVLTIMASTMAACRQWIDQCTQRPRHQNLQGVPHRRGRPTPWYRHGLRRNPPTTSDPRGQISENDCAVENGRATARWGYRQPMTEFLTITAPEGLLQSVG